MICWTLLSKAGKSATPAIGKSFICLKIWLKLQASLHDWMHYENVLNSKLYSLKIILSIFTKFKYFTGVYCYGLTHTSFYLCPLPLYSRDTCASNFLLRGMEWCSGRNRFIYIMVITSIQFVGLIIYYVEISQYCFSSDGHSYCLVTISPICCNLVQLIFKTLVGNFRAVLQF